jgi:hypothetical protein
LDETTGLLSGRPGPHDVGEDTVTVRVTVAYPDEVPKTSKSGSEFQKRRTDPALRRECVHEFVLKTTTAQ